MQDHKAEVNLLRLKFVDPKTARQELPLKQAKDRRQKLIQENRYDKIEENKKTKEKQELRDPKQLSIMIKELTQALNNYMSVTTQEIDNIRRIVELNHQAKINENQRQENTIKSIENRMQNIIDKQKEIWMKHESLESLITGMIEYSQKYPIKEYSGYKKIAKEKKTNYKARKWDMNQNTHWFGPPKNVIKSILFDKYKWNKGRVVVKTDNKLKIYQVSISRKSGNMFIYININNQWRRYREFYKNNKLQELFLENITSLKHSEKIIRKRIQHPTYMMFQ